MLVVPNFTYDPFDEWIEENRMGLVRRTYCRVVGRVHRTNLRCGCGSVFEVPIEPGLYTLQCPGCRVSGDVLVEALVLV